MMMTQAEAMTVVVPMVMAMIVTVVVLTVVVMVVRVILRVAMRMGIFHVLRSYYLPAGYRADEVIFLAIILAHGNKAIDHPAICAGIGRMGDMGRDHVY